MAPTVKTQTPPTLKQGSKGEAVKGLQNALNVRGNLVGMDGVFGPATKDAVLQFQHDTGLVQDGIVGPNTWGSLCVHLVQRGHTMSGIAEERLGDAARWPEIFDLNRDIVPDANRIFPGQVLALPFEAC
ncbi:MAG TPA: peptidoglycan-binding protein [Thermoleophilaceae bacterium]|nr:peptidoglycan-binding protein [Thermoleophilaceae bacterium]